MPKITANTSSAARLRPTANSAIATGSAPSTQAPSVRSRQPRPSQTYSSRPATCAGPTVITTINASAVDTPLSAKAGITCAHSAACASA